MASPWSDPWTWFPTLLVPWVIVAAPLGAMCLRLTLGTTRAAVDEDYVRTAVATGIAPWPVVRRHAAPASYVTTASFVAISIPLIVSNLVLVEHVMSVPGFFRHHLARRRPQVLRPRRGPGDRRPDPRGLDVAGRRAGHRHRPDRRLRDPAPRPAHPPRLESLG